MLYILPSFFPVASLTMLLAVVASEQSCIRIRYCALQHVNNVNKHVNNFIPFSGVLIVYKIITSGHLLYLDKKWHDGARAALSWFRRMSAKPTALESQSLRHPSENEKVRNKYFIISHVSHSILCKRAFGGEERARTKLLRDGFITRRCGWIEGSFQSILRSFLSPFYKSDPFKHFKRSRKFLWKFQS